MVPGPNMYVHYDLTLIVISVVIAILSAYAALDLAGRVTSSRGTAARFGWMGGGAVAMGIGIWSMHYIGMLAFRMPMAVLYDWPTVLLSMGAAVAASGIALFIASREKMGFAATFLLGPSRLPVCCSSCRHRLRGASPHLCISPHRRDVEPAEGVQRNAHGMRHPCDALHRDERREMGTWNSLRREPEACRKHLGYWDSKHCACHRYDSLFGLLDGRHR